MYPIHKTDGIVLKILPIGEADLSFLIFTRDFGLIYLKAMGARKVSSKLRPHLQEFCLSSIAFVRGKRGIRLTGAEVKEDFYKSMVTNRSLAIVAKAVLLLRRLCPKDEPNENLFEIFKNGFRFLAENNIKNESMLSAECVFAIRILKSLGYLSDDSLFSPFLQNDWSEHTLSAMNPVRKVAVAGINDSIKHSHL